MSIPTFSGSKATGAARVVMFTGKGGVGKTTCAAATALQYASPGKKTLAISTDATPSLSHIFEVTGKIRPARVSESLYINELGLTEIRQMWDRKFGREVYEVFSSFVSVEYEEFVEFMTSILPGLGDEFMVDYIRELAGEGEYDVIVWDTAPLGQTLALLQTPSLLRQHLRMAPRIYSKLKLGKRSREPILDTIKRWELLSADNMEFLRIGVEFCMITIPEALAIEQLDYVFSEMGKFELKVSRLIVNNVVEDEDSDFLAVKSAEQRHYLKVIYEKCSNLSVTELPMFPYELRGLARLAEIGKVLYPQA
jgi:arsenite/tail-anchored protein-transporting ATPase